MEAWLSITFSAPFSPKKFKFIFLPKKRVTISLCNRVKDVMHPPGVEPGPIAWKAIILPLDQECSLVWFDYEIFLWM